MVPDARAVRAVGRDCEASGRAIEHPRRGEARRLGKGPRVNSQAFSSSRRRGA